MLSSRLKTYNGYKTYKGLMAGWAMLPRFPIMLKIDLTFTAVFLPLPWTNSKCETMIDTEWPSSKAKMTYYLGKLEHNLLNYGKNIQQVSQRF